MLFAIETVAGRKYSKVCIARVAVVLAATTIWVGCHVWDPLDVPPLAVPIGMPADVPPQSYHEPQAMVPVVPPVDPVGGLPNPITIPTIDSEFLWNQVVDTVDDYFTIATEQRVQQIGGLLTEGYVETRPQPGATWLEPWHWDSTTVDERNLATLQSIRRRALVRVISMAGSYQIAVQVAKELEDVDHPAYDTPGASTPRHDGTLVRLLDVQDRGPITLGWISIGRDTALEQEILRDLQGRLAVSP